MTRRWCLAVVLLFVLYCVNPAWAQPEPISETPTTTDQPNADTLAGATNIYDRLDRFACTEVAYLLYLWIPDYFYSDEPDSVVDVINYWDVACGPAEPITRIRILGSIWDGSFNEEMYDETIIDELIWRYDPVRTHGFDGEFHPDLASGGVASESDFVANRDSYDQFTTDLADQLLPHVPPGSLEAFFCLFYSGQQAAAFELLKSDRLSETKLGVLHRREVRLMTEDRWVPFFGLTGGRWRSSGNLKVVGDHTTVGLFAGAAYNRFRVQFTFDVRLGRSANPYFVSKDDIEAWSDRFNATAPMVEAGYVAWSPGAHEFAAYGGFGLLNLRPFKEEELYINCFTYLFGLGYRLYLDADKNWYLNADVRREWISNSNKGGTDLDGQAWSLRAGIGLSLDKERDRRLDALGH